MKDVAYKYLEGRYLEALLNGDIYLNSYSNIRRLEKKKMDELIGDQHEGLGLNKVGCLFIDPSLPNNNKNIENLRKAGGSNFTGGARGIIIGGKYTRETNDAWMFCASCERNDAYWMEQSGYDKCIKINDVFQLFERCAIELEKEYKMRSSWGDCKYEEIWGVVDNGIVNEPSYYRKSELFKSQKERRLVFEPFQENASRNLQPKVIKIKVDDLLEPLN